jgi:hypothetical protein
MDSTSAVVDRFRFDSLGPKPGLSHFDCLIERNSRRGKLAPIYEVIGIRREARTEEHCEKKNEKVPSSAHGPPSVLTAEREITPRR